MPNTAPGLVEKLSQKLEQNITVEDLAAYVAGVSAHPYYVELFATPLQNYSNRVPMTSNAELWSKAVQLGREVIWLHTYGARGESRRRLTSIVEHSAGIELPEYAVAVKSDMPEKAFYDDGTRILSLGTGRWHNVDPRVWEYTVGGVNIIDSWVGYRRKKPKGRKSSPLDDIILTNWTPELSREFHELLVVLTRLVAIEEEQAQLLDAVMESKLLTYDMLQEQGVQFPKSAKDRKPRLIPEGQGTHF